MLQTFPWIDPDPGERIKQELLFSKRFPPNLFLALIGLAQAGNQGQRLQMSVLRILVSAQRGAQPPRLLFDAPRVGHFPEFATGRREPHAGRVCSPVSAVGHHQMPAAVAHGTPRRLGGLQF
jgi:hypothetical protein